MRTRHHPSLLLITALCLNAVARGQCPVIGTATSTGGIESVALNEVSGLAASRQYPGVLWAHNDSGDTARLFALSESGNDLGTYTLEGVTAEDWEDIAIGPGATPETWMIYVGDIGDNSKTRPNVLVHMVPEPQASLGQEPVDHLIGGVVTMTLTYPGGTAHDAETLMVDPVTGDLFIVTKIITAVNAKVFRKPAPHTAGTFEMVEIASGLTGGTSTGGEISPNGDAIVVRNYAGAYIWRRAEGQSIASALAGTRCNITLAEENQGESICFTGDGCAILTVSEGTGSELHRYERAGVCVTPTPTETPTPTGTATATDSSTPTPTPSGTASPTPTATPTGTPTPTDTPTPTSSESPTPTETATTTPTATETDTPTPTPSPTDTGTHTPTPTPTDSETPTPTGTGTATPTSTPTATATATPYNGRDKGDFDHSGCTDITDFLFLLDHWLTEVEGGLIGVDDFLALLDNWLLGPDC